MRNRQHDNRLCLRPYREALEGVETQFALIRFSLKKSTEGLIQQFYKERHDTVNANIDKLLNYKVESPEEAKEWRESLEDMRDYAEKKHKKQSRPADNRFKIELSQDRLNQSELLLLVAHFESFMKEVHRTFLSAAPAKVFSKRDTKVELSEVFDTQAGSPFGKFLKELIIKEVKRLDAQNIEQRAKYFADHFGVSFGKQSEVDQLKEIMKTRNRIAHEIYSAPPAMLEEIKEQPLVSDEMLRQARRIFREVPDSCIKAGAKTYQSYFRYAGS
jgi:hypothetical protein